MYVRGSRQLRRREKSEDVSDIYRAEEKGTLGWVDAASSGALGAQKACSRGSWRRIHEIEMVD